MNYQKNEPKDTIFDQILSPLAGQRRKIYSVEKGLIKQAEDLSEKEDILFEFKI